MLQGVQVGVLPTQPLPEVPVDVVLAQPLSGVPGIRLRCHRRPVRLLLPGHQGLVVSTVIQGVGAKWWRLLLSPRGLPGRQVLWVAEEYTGSSRFHERRCEICERSGVVS